MITVLIERESTWSAKVSHTCLDTSIPIGRRVFSRWELSKIRTGRCILEERNSAGGSGRSLVLELRKRRGRIRFVF